MTSIRDCLTRTLRTLNGFRVGFGQKETQDAGSSTFTVDPEQLITKNFKLKELYRSDTANKHKIDNTPKTQELVDALIYITEHILQPVRSHFGRSVIITSGYRSPELNKLISSKPSTSQHLKGEAVDFVVEGITAKEVCEWIRDNLEYDQLILEKPDSPYPWAHVSLVKGKDSRMQALTILSDKSVKLGIV